MNKTWKSFIHNPWAVTIGGGLIVAFVIWCFPAVWKSIQEALTWIWDQARAVRSLPTWLIFLLSCLAIPTLLRAAKAFWNLEHSHTIDGMRWRWRVRKGKIVDLACYCPHDETQLRGEQSNTENTDDWDDGWHMTYHCGSCSESFGPFGGAELTYREAIERQLQRGIRTGSWHEISQSGASVMEGTAAR